MFLTLCLCCQFSKCDVEQWFQKQCFSVCVNGRSAELVWADCLRKYKDSSLPSSVVGIQSPMDSSKPYDSVSSSQHNTATEMKYNEDDDIDALLSSAGTFVRDKRMSASSLIGHHSAVCTSSLVQHGHESSVNVSCDDVPAANIVDCETTAANESSSYLSANNSVSRSSISRHSAGQLH